MVLFFELNFYPRADAFAVCAPGLERRVHLLAGEGILAVVLSPIELGGSLATLEAFAVSLADLHLDSSAGQRISYGRVEHVEHDKTIQTRFVFQSLKIDSDRALRKTLLVYLEGLTLTGLDLVVLRQGELADF